MRPWKTLSRKTVLNYSKYLTVESHTVELPDGRVISDWPWLITPDFVIAVAITQESKFVLFRQTKYAIEGTSLAPVGGLIELGEDPLAAAKRELMEETGYEAAEWIDLGHYRVDGNQGAGTAHLFLAKEACRIMQSTSDDLEEQELLLMSRSEVERALLAGEFKVLAWATAVSLALQRLE